MTFESRQTIGRLPAALLILGMALMMAACGSDSGNGTAEVEMPADGDGMTGDGGEPMMTELGEWNTLMPGALDIGDANSLLRAYYDDAGTGRVAAAMPVQPAGTGSATWTGMWSGKVADDADGWPSYGVTYEDLQELGGEARITAYFEGGGVEAELAYTGIGFDFIGLAELTSDRVSVTGGTFEPAKAHSFTYVSQQGGGTVTVTGTFAGKGAFGGADAEGVVGHLGGPLSLEYGAGPRPLGTLQTVFYGTQDDN